MISKITTMLGPFQFRIQYRFSLLALTVVFISLCYSSLVFYPKFKRQGSEATISWDVSGYYHYLPAVFIYKDLKKLEFQDQILQKYRPTPERQQSFEHSSGSFVMMYPCGQALQMLPFFITAHLYAQSSGSFQSDGYSYPYQLSLSLGALVIALIGLMVFRRFLLYHFDDTITAITIILIGLGTNYFEYAGITGAMTHNNLFSLYALLLVVSHRFHIRPTMGLVIGIGAIIGLMALTRPTEIIAGAIPILYGFNLWSKGAWRVRISFLHKHYKKVLIAVLCCGLVGSIQLVYWRYVTGDWLVYSYQHHGFSWTSPHVLDGLFSFNNGWLIYTPLMAFAIVGMILILLYQNSKFQFVFPFFLIFIYIAFSWDIWWYGGSLGQRTMVQIYPILAIPLAVFIKKTTQLLLVRTVFLLLCCGFIYGNLWLTYQAHKGNMLLVEQMNSRYFFKTFGTWMYNPEDLKLLDNDDVYYDVVEDHIALNYTVESSSIDSVCYDPKIIVLDSNCPFSPQFLLGTIPITKEWIRLSAQVSTPSQEWNFWHMPQVVIKYFDEHGQVIKSNTLRLHRFVESSIPSQIYIDSRIPGKPFAKAHFYFWNANGSAVTTISEIEVIAFGLKN